jgi:hypothetical protein
MAGDEDKISDKLKAKFPGGISVVAAGGTYAGLTLYRYPIDTHTKLRQAFEIIDEVQKTIEGLDIADKGADSVYYTGTKNITQFPGGALDSPARRADISVSAYIDKLVQESKERAWAKADVLYSMMLGVMTTHEEDAHSDESIGRSAAPIPNGY